MDISYSDSAASEARVLALLKSAPDVSSSARIAPAAWDDWAMRYHLSPQRSNLLRHLDFSDLDVLELGAGMGAVSRFLAEAARELFVVEGTQARFDALCERLRDLKNWRGVVANIADVEIEKKFDVVCVIGVLEYSQLYVAPPAGETAFSWFLKRAASFLKDDGVLILAIENRLGLKYFSGAAEDHTGKLFDGICGYPRGASPKTFSRRELRELLETAGLPEIDEQFPFPDYKLPGAVLSEKIAREYSQLACDIATSRLWENYAPSQLRYFPESLAYEGAARAGLLPEFANSFLFLAAKNDASKTRAQLLRREIERGEIAWYYSLERPFPCATVFSEVAPTSQIEVAKTLLREYSQDEFRVQAGELSLRWQAPETGEVSGGEKLRARLLRRAYFGEWREFQDELSHFLKWSMERWALPENDAQSSTHLRGEALEAVAGNAIKGGENYRLFDLEWRAETPLRKSLFVFHNVVGLPVHGIAFFHGAPFGSLKKLYETLCFELKIAPDFSGDLRREADLLHAMTAQKTPQLFQGALRRLFLRPLFLRRFARRPEIESAFLNAPFFNATASSRFVQRAAKVPRFLKNKARAILRRR